MLPEIEPYQKPNNLEASVQNTRPRWLAHKNIDHRH